MNGALWRCDRCGRRFANTNQWHACTDLSVDEHLAGKSPHAVQLYRALEAAVERCGPFRRHAAKTRIAFIARMSFAGATLRKSWINVAFILAGPVDSPRFHRLEVFGPAGFGHHVRIRDLGEVDDELQEWLCEAHRRGRQEIVGADTAPVVTGDVLARTRAAFATRVQRSGGGLQVPVPAYVARAFAEHPGVVMRVAGVESVGVIRPVGDGSVLDLPADLAELPAGELVDVMVRPDAGT